MPLLMKTQGNYLFLVTNFIEPAEWRKKRNESNNSNTNTAGWKDTQSPQDWRQAVEPQATICSNNLLLYNTQLKHPGFAIFKGEIWKGLTNIKLLYATKRAV